MPFEPLNTLAAAAGALAVMIVFVLSIALATLRTRVALRAESCRIEQRLVSLGAEFSRLAEVQVKLRERLDDIGGHIADGQCLAQAQSPADGRAYELAARLAASGAAAGELAAACGLSAAEAELAVLVHGSRNRAARGH